MQHISSIRPSPASATQTRLTPQMFRPVHAVPVPHLYALGNTPAVCLTQDLPPEQSADCLLLGCGDCRNILCTVYYNELGTYFFPFLWN
jgi:Domain of unknown function (DUF4470)